MGDHIETIALVADKFMVDMKIEEQLKKEGFNAVMVKKAPDLIKALVKLSPAIIIIDLDHQNQDNPLAVISAIKKEAQLKESEVFIYTEGIDVRTEVALRKLKVQSYFTKSKNTELLINGVRNHFSWDEMTQEYNPWEDEEENDDDYIYDLREEEQIIEKQLVKRPRHRPPDRPSRPAATDGAPTATPAQQRRPAPPPQEAAPPPQEAAPPAREEPAPAAKTPSDIEESSINLPGMLPEDQKESDTNEFMEMLTDFQNGISKKLDDVEKAPGHGQAAEVENQIIQDGPFKAENLTSEGEALLTQPENFTNTDEFQDLLNEFHAGLDNKLANMEKGHESHYNLGISYFEMGLFEQALEQFEKCVGTQEYKLRSMNMIGAIHRKLGAYDKAVESFKACHMNAPDEYSKLSFRYEIADTFMTQGKMRDAYKMFATVYKVDKGFKDTRAKLIKIKSALEANNQP